MTLQPLYSQAQEHRSRSGAARTVPRLQRCLPLTRAQGPGYTLHIPSYYVFNSACLHVTLILVPHSRQEHPQGSVLPARLQHSPPV